MRTTGIAGLALLGWLGCTDVEVTHDVSYDDRFGEATTMDVYVPGDVRPDSPAVMLIHGGGWRSFSKAIYTDQARRLADTGYVVASINYRLVPDGGRYPNIFRDCFCALGFLQTNAADYSIDPLRIAVAGYSAGGHLTGLLALAEPTGDFAPDCATPPLFAPAAGIDGAGPSDLTLYGDNDVISDLLGGREDEVPERYQLASPVNHVDADDPPMLLLHGSDDLFVPYEHTEVLERALEQVGVDVRVLRLRGGGHLTNPAGDLVDAVLPLTASDAPEAWAATIDFLDDTLGAP